ncbi:PREDICTED: pentatricopeptide repeat-containing [Prunus dulcis]|uniref:PREDICTED: pentatricopeptide repeat-containing n=1 Tax=Prunus dulcis TaxID=3755 RepID=A0A5E4F473_PRUDU|nr:putative pentatricopeptide repeat-containing protein At1g53330 [Prunus dulcis]VVA21441.1 PREDICTED: pentatricopeptide repeat-containing [Prunus dulcis]
MNASKSLSPFRLSSLLRRQKDPILALQLFQNPNSDSTPQPKKSSRYSLLSYDLIITKLGRAKMFDQMDQILHQLKQETRFAPPEIIFCNVISFYGRAHLPDRALQIFDEIPTFRCHRTVKSLNSLLNALLRCGEFEKMWKFFVGIEKYATPDACTYNILMKACCSNEYLDDAWKVLDEMSRKGIPPNSVTMASLIYCLCSNLKLKEAFTLKEDMARVYGVPPTIFVYTSLMKGLCKIGEMSLAFRLKEEMIMRKIKPDAAVYSTLISGLFKLGRKGEVFGLLEEMSEYGCKLNTVTYNAMINGFCKEKDFEAAYKVLDEMVEKGCEPDVISYNVILGGLCQEGKWSEANDLFEDLPRRGCTPDVVSYRIMFTGLCDCRQFREAALILDELIFKGYAPHRLSAHKLVEGLCREGDMELLRTVLTSLGNGNVLHVDTWAMVISIVYKKEKLSNVSELVDTLLVQ